MALALALLTLPALLAPVKGEGTSWTERYGLLPDVTAWILARATLDVVRGSARVLILARRQPLSIGKT